ncbi:caspase recruitment domain-containing protein 19-like isoform X2 [Balaenoptera acutorostrata]|uniref:Caspase recruitment domain-containing protein 19-like isoform X2 n=1 Tax=Balaenoptera acutorostrata TaxID=9767 RepID=A0ABM3TR88_BALAC|nr:caspase recruitment domain-containing protein 19-like isoform X2 [Balaenoptera acutorostrata]
MPFLTGLGRLSEQQVDRIILQLNRYYPQILSNKDAEKFRNPKVPLRVRLCDLLGRLQRSGERDCQEFYRDLYIHAQPLHSCLPSRHTLRPVAFLTCLGLAAGLALLVYCCPPRWVLPGQASAQSSPDHGAEPCRMDGGLHLRPPTCGPAWQPCGSFPAMLTLSRSCVGSQWQAGPLGMGTPHHSGVGLAMP